MAQATRGRRKIYGEQFTLRLASPVRGCLEELARLNGRSLAEEVREALAAHVREQIDNRKPAHEPSV